MNSRLKVYLSTAVLILGLESINVYNYTKHGLVPFKENKYNGHKVIMQEEDNKDDKSISFYTTKEYEDDAVVVKTPYKKLDNNYVSEVTFYDTDSLSNKNIEFIKDNADNQKKLLKNSGVKSIINSTTTDNIIDCTYLQTDVKPLENEYQINYVTFENDYSDTKLISDYDQDIKLNTMYIASCLTSALVPSLLAYTVLNKNKGKKLTK